ncbi:TRAPP II complex [Lentinula edodes]|nr:TRAPP II complex [Lentinula edodes]
MELQLSLNTSGVSFEFNPISVIIPACSYHRTVLCRKSLATGSLIVRGCIVRAAGGVAREFVLPLVTEDEEEHLAHKCSAALCEAGRFNSGSKSSPSSKAVMFLQCKLVPEQPLYRIRRTTVTHGALMLYDGEMFPIGIRFENIPPLPIDFIQLAFDDSTMTPAQEALTEGELSVFETYETEYALIHRPVFFWIKNDSVAIAPGRNVTLTINCFGKQEGTIHASYSYIHRDPFDNEEASVFHTGQLSYPLMITVYRMLESHEMDILPYPYPTGTDDNLVINKSNLFVQDNGAWCLFSVDIMNRYGIPFEVSIERIQEDVPWGKTLVNVPPGSTSRYNVGQSVYAKLNTLCRLVIPLEKFLSGDEHISRPIPSLCDRQFVVDKTKLSDAEQKMQRKLFCYGEELFKCLRCRWREAGETRYGDLSLRNQRLTLTMLKTLRTEKAGI